MCGPVGPIGLELVYTTTGEGSARPLTFAWAVEDSSARKGALQNELAGQQGEDYVFLSPAAFNGVNGGISTLGKQYKFTLTVTDFLGNSAPPKKKTVKGAKKSQATNFAPTVQIDAGDRAQPIYYNTSVTLIASATLATCIAGGDVAPDYWLWTANKGVQLDAEDAARPELIISGQSLPVGIVNFNAQACIGDFCGVNNAKVRRFPAPVIAKIAGGDRTVGQDSPLTLDCSSSTWPDAAPGQSLTYSWGCNDSTVNLGDATGAQLTLPPSVLAAGWYTFTCSASSGTQSDDFSVAVTVESGEVPFPSR